MQLSIEELSMLVARDKVAVSSPSHSFSLGKSYFIIAGLPMYTGRVVAITDSDIVLEDAAWIASMGRHYDALKNGVFDECEPFIEPLIISRAAIVCATEWMHALPREQK